MDVRNDTKLSSMSDEEIIALYWQRDENAIRATDAKYRDYLMAIARNIVRDLRDCEECLNDTYLDAWNAIPPKRPTLLQAFLATIMRRTAIDRYRANTRDKRVPTDAIDSFDELEYVIAGGEPPAKMAEAEHLAALISGYVRALPKRRKYVFMARYFAARSIAEVAESLSCSEATVNRDIARIRDELRALLKKEGYLC
jgi:RNA polymerase sigma-70 factor (ECF subfamily)